MTRTAEEVKSYIKSYLLDLHYFKHGSAIEEVQIYIKHKGDKIHVSYKVADCLANDLKSQEEIYDAVNAACSRLGDVKSIEIL